MEKEPEKLILASSPQVTELLKKIISENTAEVFRKANVPNLADYSTKFENIR